jgi:RNA polymerase sigma factor (sigma-70 family)
MASVSCMPTAENRNELLALADRVRMGDDGAFAALYQRYAPFARRAANQIVADPDAADDVVHDAFSLVLRLLRSGAGPRTSFAGYLMSTVHRLAHRHCAERRRVVPTGNVDLWDDRDPEFVPAARQLDDAAVAWASLPRRWRSLVWLIEVDRYAPRELAPFVRMSPTAVSSMAVRARDALRTAYIAQRVSDDAADPCLRLLPGLAALARGRLGGHPRRRLADHLRCCRRCRRRLRDLMVCARQLPVR